MIRTVAALVLDDVATFELGIACEVFGIDRTEDGVPPFDFRICGPEAGVPLRLSVGSSVVPERGLDGLHGADLVIVVPSWRGSGEELTDLDPEILHALRAAHADGAIMLSLCSGAFILAAAGLLDGRPCTTHWRHAATLREMYPVAKVDEDVLFVDDGSVVTSAGTAAGIDAALHLVRREIGSDVANAIARRMVVPPQRDGGQRQFIERPVPTCSDDVFAEVLDWMVEHLDEQQPVARLAELAGMSPRTFARRFSAETGTTPVQWLVQQRIFAARTLLESTSLDVDHVAHRCGFSSATLLRHHFRRLVGVTPGEYRRTFATV
ncbi:GlxA family transcriptional regulator [Mumia zhuanghuii]|uniref:Helix-turn-helix domain-containing protein n=1 Tax=Mumia zhuanghuii TaxID=2585211 RepID=A0A5C4MUL5_9ACTN|nr:helix-turn-helix domain-containing protein [Mumia zhuanghuii]TNC43586.1 helix-turn-helix domain-containing protein [Mumia zhuanghuii]TNC48633.1 helix-turn-helix domain-containing protein [Mumia zhuanghuii]